MEPVSVKLCKAVFAPKHFFHAAISFLPQQFPLDSSCQSNSGEEPLRPVRLAFFLIPELCKN